MTSRQRIEVDRITARKGEVQTASLPQGHLLVSLVAGLDEFELGFIDPPQIELDPEGRVVSMRQLVLRDLDGLARARYRERSAA
jgi:hypothetical protein